jgi:hypothetical protein
VRVTIDDAARRQARRDRWRRLAWFAALYLAGLGAMLIVAYLLKALIPGA